MTLTHRLDHETVGLAYLISRFVDKPNIRAFILPYLTQIQEIEDALWQVYRIVPDLETQVGEQLNLIGRLIGQDRKGYSDADYLRWIQCRLLLNRSSGLTDEIIQIIDLMISNTRTIRQYGPASFYIWIDDLLVDLSPTILAEILTEARGAGIIGGIIYSEDWLDARSFTFADGDTADADVNRGWGDGSTDPTVDEYPQDPPLLVAVGGLTTTSKYLITSPDGINWTSQTVGKTLGLYAVAWSPTLSIFAAAGWYDTDTYILTSPDGITWTERAGLTAQKINDLVWVGDLGLFVGVGPAGADSHILTSPDGITWTERVSPKAVTLDAIAWSQDLGLLCAVGAADGATDSFVVTSPDGVTWTERVTPKNFNLFAIAWSPLLQIFVAAGASDGADALIISSADGITWSEQGNPGNYGLYSISWSTSLNLFAAVGEDIGGGSGAYLVTSPDGITWTQRVTPVLGQNAFGITWSADLALFIVVGDGGTCFTSSDGITWTQRTTPSAIQLNNLAQVNYTVGGRLAKILGF